MQKLHLVCLARLLAAAKSVKMQCIERSIGTYQPNGLSKNIHNILVCNQPWGSKKDVCCREMEKRDCSNEREG